VIFRKSAFHGNIENLSLHRHFGWQSVRNVSQIWRGRSVLPFCSPHFNLFWVPQVTTEGPVTLQGPVGDVIAGPVRATVLILGRSDQRDGEELAAPIRSHKSLSSVKGQGQTETFLPHAISSLGATTRLRQSVGVKNIPSQSRQSCPGYGIQNGSRALYRCNRRGGGINCNVSISNRKQQKKKAAISWRSVGENVSSQPADWTQITWSSAPARKRRGMNILSETFSASRCR